MRNMCLNTNVEVLLNNLVLRSPEKLGAIVTYLQEIFLEHQFLYATLMAEKAAKDFFPSAMKSPLGGKG